MRLIWSLIMMLLLSSSAVADLNSLLKWQQVGDSGAYVSSGFHDWRGLSKYRRSPGLHAGYDIAMLAGSAVRTPWKGRVVAITPWYGSEVGVTLLLDTGYEATFGHITAAVSVGQSVPVGGVLGRVVVDHVDVKMRDYRGRAFDFRKQPLASEPVPGLADPSPELKQNFELYREQLEQVAKLELQQTHGLVAPQRVQAARERLHELRPLAELHSRHAGVELPAKAPLQDDLAPQQGRPVTDWLLSR